jgi:hypothetical protein
MLFQFFSRRVKQEMPPAETDIQERSKQQMFEHDRERHKVLPTTSTDAHR